uniref:TTF-type domain-containing protein n=1 Tax=Brassica oleracea var. oleracea TaxID=109376 RepID=A0A0D3BHK8_BRAOL
MEKYYKKISTSVPETNANDLLLPESDERKDKRKSPPVPDTNIDDFPSDPGERKDIMDYPLNQRDEVRRRYLTKDEVRMQGGSDAFVKEGFNSWQKPKRLLTHMGKPPNSCHIIAAQKCEDLMNQHQSIVHDLFKLDDKVKNEYRIRLNASTDALRFLLRQGLPFRGHEEVRQAILEEIGHGMFGLLVDESADVSHKEQMGVVFRFVDKRGAIKERFIGVVHVKETSSLTLKSAIDDLFARYGMSITKVRGQGYDRASNMRAEFNGLRSLVSRESSSAYYVHCFAHQLQLVVVAVAKKHFNIADFFYMISTLLNIVGASCKRQDMFREIQREELEKGIKSGDVKTGTRQNQERSLARPATTRWGTHHKTLLRLEELFSTTIKVLEYIQDEGWEDLQKRQACGLLKYFHTFDWLTANLSLTLQQKDQDILNAMSLVGSTKRELQKLRDDGWDLLMAKVASIQEFNDRFTEVTTDLLICMAALSPVDSFHGFDKEKLVRLAKLYPDDSSYGELLSLEQQLDINIDNIYVS